MVYKDDTLCVALNIHFHPHRHIGLCQTSDHLDLIRICTNEPDDSAIENTVDLWACQSATS